MSVPEGYAVAPTSSDHLVKIAVPVPDRDPILIEAPAISWLPPTEVEAVEEWSEAMVADEREVNAWHKENDHLPKDERAPFPAKKAKLVGDGDPVRKRQLVREMKLRWLKPHMPEDEYMTLLTADISELTINWVFDQINKPDAIDAISSGESGASTDS